ncbi:MAG: NADPH:quinone reductase-like Zn-dependent oxidoreductase [Cyclobacteriaceae bacterium]|jgi:NADPH:quinone reductase-like Zn-dependent oxidoreductase
MLKTGSYAEYICVPQAWKHGVIALKPTNLTYKESAALPIGGMTALFLLEKARIAKSQKVLVFGASGSVGTYAVQIAKHFGAAVTGVCSTSNLAMVVSLGAKKVIDYTKVDYTLSESDFDIVFDAVGKTSRSKTKNAMKKNGVFVSVEMLTKETTEHLLKLKELAEQGAIVPFIDKCYPLEKIVDAHLYVDQGHKRGNVVIDIKE